MSDSLPIAVYDFVWLGENCSCAADESENNGGKTALIG